MWVFRFECKGPALVVRYRRMLWHGGACTLVVRYKHASWHGGVVECTGTQTWMNECVSYDFLWVSAAFADFFALSPVDTYGIEIFIYVFIFSSDLLGSLPSSPLCGDRPPLRGNTLQKITLRFRLLHFWGYILHSDLLGSLPSSPFCGDRPPLVGTVIRCRWPRLCVGDAPLWIIRWLDAPARPSPLPPGFNYGLEFL